MKVVAVQTSANTDGLTAMLAEAALEGAGKAGAEVELVHLNQLQVESCRACNRGWGTCRTEGRCEIEDDLQGLRDKIAEADGLVFATPVYFGGLSESAKRMLDRWRRCECFDRENSPLRGKPVIGIAAAGGSGGGAVKCLLDLEEYLRYLQFQMHDLVPVTQRNREWRLAGLMQSGHELVRTLGTQDTN